MPNGYYDIEEMGGVPGTNCDVALEAAYQAAVAYGKPSTIHFGAGQWSVSRPLVMGQNDLTIRGEGVGTTMLFASGAFSPFYIGVARTSGGKTLVPANRPDAYGKLDATVAPTTGVAYGYRMLEAHLGFWSCAFDKGASDGWRSTRKITVMWCYEGGPIQFGMMAQGDVANPWLVVFQDGIYYFKYMASDEVHRHVALTVPGDPNALHRLAFQLDLEAGNWQFYADGMQRGAGTITGGMSFKPVDDAVFLVGQLGMDLAVLPNTPDRTVYGLRVSAGPLYHNNGVGQPQVRLDGSTQVDSHYTVATPDLIACILVSKPPEWPAGATPPADMSRAIWFANGAASGEYSGGYGLFLNSGYHGGGQYNPFRQSVRDLSIDLNYARWGNALTVGGVLGLDIRNASFMYGWHAIGSAPMGVCWLTKVVDVLATGYDSSVFLFGHSLFMERIDCGWAGTTAMRLKSCAGAVRDVWINGQTARAEKTIEIVGVDDASWLTFEQIKCNQEGYPFPTIAAFHCIPGTDYKEIPLRVRLNDIYWGNVGPDASLVRLEEGKPPQVVNKCHLMLDGAHMDVSNVGVVTTGPRWIGTVAPGPSAPGKIWLVHEGPGESGLELIDGGGGGGGGTSMSSLMYNSARVKLQDGTIDLVTDTIHAMLVTSAYVPDRDAHSSRADVTGEVVGLGYTAGGMPLVNKSVGQDNVNDRGKFDADDLTWPVATLIARGAVIYKSRGGAASADEVIDYLDFGEDISSSNGPFTLEFHADGIHHIG